MIVSDEINVKVHADFLPQKPQQDRRELDWLRITMFKNMSGDWSSKIITLSPEQARAVALAIIEHYGPEAREEVTLV